LDKRLARKLQVIYASLNSATFILAEEGDFAGMNEEWIKWFAKDPPARQGAKLPVRPKSMKVSIAVIAEV
jgi:2-iminobutanoate/2-iminopropanoate deaminase